MSEEIVERFRRARRDPALAVLEGFHAVKHAARFGAEILVVATSDAGALTSMTRELAPDVAEALAETEVVADEDLARLMPRPHPTGVVAIARRPVVRLESLLEDPRPAPVVVLEEPRRPENLGAAVRVAAAAEAAGLVVLGGADPWHPAALRGAAGLHFALPVARATSLEELLGDTGPAKASPTTAPAGGGETGLAPRRPLLALDPAGEPLAPGVLPARALLAFGSERRGLSPALLARADRRLAIPMGEGISSLNLATAVAVTLYSWRWAAPLQANL